MAEREFSTAVDQARWVADGQVTARSLVEHSLATIDALDHAINAFVSVRRQAALEEADALDAEAAAGVVRGSLHGVPVAIKDENDVAGLPTAYGGGSVTSPAAADSEVVARLKRAGAIVIGKTRMPEFGIWPFTETAANGWTRNPWDLTRSPAGSSGGTAAAVAAGMVAVGIGGDGGGSIRLPSSWCGLFGLKPQRGRVSASPHPDLWRALGTLGPIARTVADAALVYDAIAGRGQADRFGATPWAGTLSAAAATPPGPLRIVVSAKNPGGSPAADRDTVAALRAVSATLRTLGHTVIEKDPRYPMLTLPFMSQVAAGVWDEARRVEHPWALEARTRRLLRVTKPLAQLAPWGEREAERIGKRFLPRLFADADLLITPTTPTAAPRVGQLDGLGWARAMAKATPVASFTSPWNVFGNPAAALPAGFTADVLPLSVQVVGPPDSEEIIVSLCAQLERENRWHERRPALGGVTRLA